MKPSSRDPERGADSSASRRPSAASSGRESGAQGRPPDRAKLVALTACGVMLAACLLLGVRMACKKLSAPPPATNAAPKPTARKGGNQPTGEWGDAKAEGQKFFESGKADMERGRLTEARAEFAQAEQVWQDAIQKLRAPDAPKGPQYAGLEEDLLVACRHLREQQNALELRLADEKPGN